VIAALVVVLGAGGLWFLVLDDDDDDSAGGGGASQEDLQAALLTQEDVGGDFALQTDDSDSDFGDPQGGPECQTLTDQLIESDDDPPDAEVELERESDLVGVRHSMSRLAEGDPGVAEIQAALTQCSSVSATGPDGTMDMQIQAEPIDGYGESALALTIDADATAANSIQVSFQFYAILWEREGIGSTLMMNGPLDPQTGIGGPPDAGLVQQLASTADQRLQQALQA
jgi:hypothetical protein